jgi:hypothetical protein
MSDVGQGAAPPPQAAPVPTAPVPSTAPAATAPDSEEQLRAQQQAYVNAPVQVAPTKGGLRPKSAEVVSEGAEAPMAAEDWKDLSQLNKNIEQTQVAKAMVARTQAENQIAQAQAKMPALQQQYEQNKAELDGARARAKSDLGKVQMMLNDVNQKKVDHGRFFAQRGTFGALAAGIAQALGASAAILSGTGRNVVAEQMNRMVDEDIAQQREEIENGRANANNALQSLRVRYDFDIPQAESALKIAQLGVMNAQLQQYEGMKMSAEATTGLDAWIAQNRKDQFMEARKIYTASVGKQTRKEQLAYQAGSPGGMVNPTEKIRHERLQTIKESQETGTIPDISREGKALEAKKKTSPENTKAQEQLDAINNALSVTQRMDALYAQKTPLTPAQRGWLEAQQDVAPMETHKAITGLSKFSEGEGKRYATAFGEKGETSDIMGKRRGALGALRETLAARKKQVEEAMRSGKGRPAEQPEADIQDVP